MHLFYHLIATLNKELTAQGYHVNQIYNGL